MNAGECSLNSQHCTYDTCQNRSDVLVNDCLLWPLPSFFFLSLLSLADCIFPHIALMYKTVLTLQSGALVKRKCGSLGGEVGRSEFSTSTLSFYESNGLTNTLFLTGLVLDKLAKVDAGESAGPSYGNLPASWKSLLMTVTELTLSIGLQDIIHHITQNTLSNFVSETLNEVASLQGGNSRWSWCFHPCFLSFMAPL